MSTTRNKLNTMLLAAAVAVFASGPVYALDEDLYDDEGTTKGFVNAIACGKRSFTRNVAPPPPSGPEDWYPILIDPEGPFQGSWALDFTSAANDSAFMGGTNLSGVYIEAKPDRRLTMGLDDADYIQLNDYVAGVLDGLCGGTLLDDLLITRFDGTFSRIGFDGTHERRFAKLTIKFRSKFTWMDLDGKMRNGRYHFQTVFENMRPVPEDD